MTIYQIKKLNKEHGGHFFDKGIMKSFGATLKSFHIRNDKTTGTFVIIHKDGRETHFSKITGRVIIP
jgi:hypothetical protein